VDGLSDRGSTPLRSIKKRLASLLAGFFFMDLRGIGLVKVENTSGFWTGGVKFSCLFQRMYKKRYMQCDISIGVNDILHM